MSSREIAELVESRHDSVKRSMETLRDKGIISFTRAVETSHEGAGARPVDIYMVNKRDSYVVVAQLSPEFTARLVDRWQELEAQQAPKLPTTYIEALEKLLEVEKEKQAVVLKLEAQKPFADFGTAVSASATQVLIGEWIKAINDGGLKIGRNKAFSWFRSNGYLADGNMPMQKYIDQGLFKVKEGLINTPNGQRATFTTMLTGKGQVYFAGKLKDYVERNHEPLQLPKK